jgi:prophage antirepressor-like protein
MFRSKMPKEWFCANDITDALGYANGRDAIAKHVDADEKDGVAISDAMGQTPDCDIHLISESGVYALVVRSNKREAKRWWKRVRGEVLPSIRRTGAPTSPPAPA